MLLSKVRSARQFRCRRAALFGVTVCCLALSLAGCVVTRAGDTDEGAQESAGGTAASSSGSASASSADTAPYVSAAGSSSAAQANDGVALILPNVDGRHPGSVESLSYARDSWIHNLPEAAGDSGVLAPVVTGDAVYTAAGSTVLKLDPATGDELVRASLDGQVASSSYASFDEGLLLVPLASGALAAFDENLVPQWQSESLGAVVADRGLGEGAWNGSHALVRGDSVYAAMSYCGQDSAGALLCVNVADGSLRWRADLGAGLVDMTRVSDIAAADDGILVPAGEKLMLYAYADGALLDAVYMGDSISGCLAPLPERAVGPNAFALINQAGTLMTVTVDDGAINLARRAEPAGDQQSAGARLANATPRALGGLIAVASFSHGGLSEGGEARAEPGMYLLDASTLQTVDVLEGVAPQGSAVAVQGMGSPSQYLVFFSSDRLVRVPVVERAFGEPEVMDSAVSLHGSLSRQELALTAEGLMVWAEPSCVKAVPALK